MFDSLLSAVPPAARVPVGFAIIGLAIWALGERCLFPTQQAADRDDRGSYWTIALAWYAAVGVSLVDALHLRWSAVGPGLAVAQWGGVALFALGIVVRFSARRALGRHFHFRVQTSASQELVTVWPYRRLRHPAYLGSLLLMVGLPWSLGSGLGLGVGVALGLPAILYRIRVEERVLAERFGERWTLYAQTRKRLLPFLW